eukprot:4952208-Pleurochrysis_carterae.AAC.2
MVRLGASVSIAVCTAAAVATAASTPRPSRAVARAPTYSVDERSKPANASQSRVATTTSPLARASSHAPRSTPSANSSNMPLTKPAWRSAGSGPAEIAWSTEIATSFASACCSAAREALPRCAAQSHAHAHSASHMDALEHTCTRARPHAHSSTHARALKHARTRTFKHTLAYTHAHIALHESNEARVREHAAGSASAFTAQAGAFSRRRMRWHAPNDA